MASLEKEYNVNAIYFDFKKAYEKVDNGVLLHKMKSFGVSNKIGK